MDGEDRLEEPGAGGDRVAAVITAELERLGATLGRPLVVQERTASTQDDAREAAAIGAPHGATFLAEEQTRGRGRGGSEWHSPRGQNVTLSVILRPDLDPAATAPLALAAGVAVAQTVDALLPRPRARLKWPNDVYVDGRKLAGVLVEASTRPGQGSRPGPVVVIGLGVNVRVKRFPEPLAATATSLALSGAQGVDRNLVAARLLHRLGVVVQAYQELGLEALHAELGRRDFLRGRPVTVGTLAGVAQGIDGQGRLVVRAADGARHAVCSGEVRWR